MASIGSARVSNREQNPDGQTDLPAAAGCEKVFVERTQDGLAAARARGRKGRGRFERTATKARQARAMYDEKSCTVQQIDETFGVSRGTIYRHLAQDARPM